MENSISDKIINARTRYLKSNANQPTKIYLDIRGMHDLWRFVESTGVLIQLIPDYHAKPQIMGMEVSYDPTASIPYAK